MGKTLPLLSCGLWLPPSKTSCTIPHISRELEITLSIFKDLVQKLASFHVATSPTPIPVLSIKVSFVSPLGICLVCLLAED